MLTINPHHIHNFVCATARQLNLKSRVTLNNATGFDSKVFIQIFAAGGELLVELQEIGDLNKNDAIFFEIEELSSRFFKSDEFYLEDLVFYFSLIPLYLQTTTDQVSISADEIFSLIGAQDHYIEHYFPTSLFCAGVLYQTPPMNTSLFPTSSSHLMQAPKVFISEQQNTLLQFIYACSEPLAKAHKKAKLNCSLRAENGDCLLTWVEAVKPNGMKLVNIKEILLNHQINFVDISNKHGFLLFEAFSAEASFISLTINLDQEQETLSIEHSLPPPYYGLKIQKQKLIEFKQNQIALRNS